MIRCACAAGDLLRGRIDVSAEIAREQALFEYALGRTPEEVLISLGARPDSFEPPSWDDAAIVIADRWIEACAAKVRTPGETPICEAGRAAAPRRSVVMSPTERDARVRAADARIDAAAQAWARAV